MKQLLIGLFLANLALPAMAAMFVVELPGLPADSSDDCQEKINDLADRVVSATDVTYIGATCQRTDLNRGGYHAELHYSADRELPRGTIVQSPLYNGYSSGAACLADFPRQVAMFQRHTGLEPVFQFCSPAGHLYLRSFATSDVKPLRFTSHVLGEYSVFDAWLEHPAALLAEIQEAVSPYVDEIADIRMQNERLSLLYYSQERLILEFASDFGYASATECDGQRGRFADIIQTFDGTAVATFCLSTEFYPAPQQQLVSLILSRSGTFYGQIKYLYRFQDPVDYASLAACQDAEESRTRYFQLQGWQVFVSQCTMIEDTNRYALVLFRQDF